MIKIAVCMNNASANEQLQEFLNEYFTKKRRTFSSTTFQTEEELIDSGLHQYHVFFIDVNFVSERNGINTARILRKKSIQGDIVFIAVDQSLAYLAFTVNALQYLILPLNKSEFNRTMEAVTMRKDAREKQVLTLNKGQKFIQIPCDKIIYFETLDRKVKVHTIKKEYIVDNKINKLESILVQYNFFRVHKSYLVNLAYVKEYDQNVICMLNDDKVYLSRLKYKQFRESFILYLKEENERDRSIIG